MGGSHRLSGPVGNGPKSYRRSPPPAEPPAAATRAAVTAAAPPATVPTAPPLTEAGAEFEVQSAAAKAATPSSAEYKPAVPRPARVEPGRGGGRAGILRRTRIRHVIGASQDRKKQEGQHQHGEPRNRESHDRPRSNSLPNIMPRCRLPVTSYLEGRGGASALIGRGRRCGSRHNNWYLMESRTAPAYRGTIGCRNQWSESGLGNRRRTGTPQLSGPRKNGLGKFGRTVRRHFRSENSTSGNLFEAGTGRRRPSEYAGKVRGPGRWPSEFPLEPAALIATAGIRQPLVVSGHADDPPQSWHRGNCFAGDGTGHNRGAPSQITVGDRWEKRPHAAWSCRPLWAAGRGRWAPREEYRNMFSRS